MHAEVYLKDAASSTTGPDAFERFQTLLSGALLYL
jgi:hypothetical protein